MSSNISTVKYEIVQNGSLLGVSTTDGTVVFPCEYKFLQLLTFEDEPKYVMCSKDASNEHLDWMGLLDGIFERQAYRYNYYRFKSPLLLYNLKKELLYQVEVDDIDSLWDWKILDCGLIAYKQNEKWGAKDENGNVILLPAFDDIYSSKDIVLYLSNGEIGILTKHGKILSIPEYNSVAYLNYENRILRCGPYAPTTIFLSEKDKKAQPHFSTNDWHEDANRSTTFTVVNGHIYAFYDKKIGRATDMQIIKSERIENVFFNQHFIVNKDSNYFVFSTKDGLLQNSKCINYWGVFDDVILVQDIDAFGTKLWGIYSLKTENVILPISFSKIDYYGSGMFIAYRGDDNASLYMLNNDSQLELIINSGCEIDILTSNLFSYKKSPSDRTYELKNREFPIVTGKSTIPFEVLYNDLVIYGTSTGKGLCNQNGLIILPGKYDEIILRKDNNYDIKNHNGGWGILSSTNYKEIISPSYRNRIKFYDNQDYLILEDFNSYKKGVVSIDGTILIPSIYDEIVRTKYAYICKIHQEQIQKRYNSYYYKSAYALYDDKGNIISALTTNEIIEVGNFVFDGNIIYDSNFNRCLGGCKKIKLLGSPYASNKVYLIQLGTEDECLLIDDELNLMIHDDQSTIHTLPMGIDAQDLLKKIPAQSFCNIESIFCYLDATYFYYSSEQYRSSLQESVQVVETFYLIDKKAGSNRIYTPLIGWSDKYAEIHFLKAYVGANQSNNNIYELKDIAIITKVEENSSYNIKLLRGEVNPYDYLFIIYSNGEMIGLRKKDNDFVFDYINYNDVCVSYYEATEPFEEDVLRCYAVREGFIEEPTSLSVPNVCGLTQRYETQNLNDIVYPIGVLRAHDLDDLIGMNHLDISL